MNFKSKIKPHNLEKKQNKIYIFKKLFFFTFYFRERFLDAFQSKIFPIKIEGSDFSDLAHVAKVFHHAQDKVSDHLNLKILIPKQMLQRLPVALEEVKACNLSENLLNEIKHFM